MTPDPSPDLRLDCRGMPCPRPIIEIARHLGEVEIGRTILVIADDPAARVDVPAWCRMRGQEYFGEIGPEETGLDAPGFVVRRLS